MTIYCTDIAPVIGANMMFGYQPYIMNQEATTKYYKIEGITSGGGWTPQAAQQLGAVVSAAGMRFDVADFMQRTLPASPVTEDVTLRISRYPDATYTDPPEAIADRVVTHKFIDSDSMTLLDLDNFDDGTVQGWTLTQGGTSPNSQLLVDSTYFISPLYSLALRVKTLYNGNRYVWGKASKSFDVPSAGEAYFVIDMMVRKIGSLTYYTTIVYNNGNIVAELNPTDHNILFDRWMRLMIPLVPGTTNAIGIYHYAYMDKNNYMQLNFDDIKIVYT